MRVLLIYPQFPTSYWSFEGSVAKTFKSTWV